MSVKDFKQKLAESVAAIQACQGCCEDVEKLAQAVVNSLREGGKIVCFGNGGSAAEAMHFAAELTGRFKKERSGLPAIALNTDMSAVTAIGNDYGFERVFERQVEALVRKEDTVIGLSTSGTSPNVLRGLEKAKRIGSKTALLTGARCQSVPSFVDICVKVPESDTALVQEAHLVILHWLCEVVEAKLSGDV
ncbi:MAG: D-sedoheptulose-7-phosphate isomerase [Candidatus Fervidibacter sp.]|uniref:D-sedoheptulose-7-phosphate isomerase n=1 Tax=Candidatus Fervidibacter sp. TaxID=3100871 RepID=UPI004049A7A4